MINMDITDKRAKFDNDNDVITLYKMKPSNEQREEKQLKHYQRNRKDILSITMK